MRMLAHRPCRPPAHLFFFLPPSSFAVGLSSSAHRGEFHPVDECVKEGHESPTAYTNFRQSRAMYGLIVRGWVSSKPAFSTSGFYAYERTMCEEPRRRSLALLPARSHPGRCCRWVAILAVAATSLAGRFGLPLTAARCRTLWPIAGIWLSAALPCPPSFFLLARERPAGPSPRPLLIVPAWAAFAYRVLTVRSIRPVWRGPPSRWLRVPASTPIPKKSNASSSPSSAVACLRFRPRHAAKVALFGWPSHAHLPVVLFHHTPPGAPKLQTRSYPPRRRRHCAHAPSRRPRLVRAGAGNPAGDPSRGPAHRFSFSLNPARHELRAGSPLKARFPRLSF